MNEGKPDHWNIWWTCSTCLVVQAAGSSRKCWWVNWQQLCGWNEAGSRCADGHEERWLKSQAASSRSRDRREKAGQYQRRFKLKYTKCVSFPLERSCCARFMRNWWFRKHLKYTESLSEKSDHFLFEIKLGAYTAACKETLKKIDVFL